MPHWFRPFCLLIASLWMPISTLAQSAQLVGRVLDQVSDEPLAYATVALHLSEDSSQVAGNLADSSGVFRLARVAAGDYYLVVRFLGYESSSQSLSIAATSEIQDIGAIRLAPTQRLLDEIEITGRESHSFHQIDRQVYNAAQFQNAKGGTAVDVVRNLPGVAVNAEGAITLRGSGGFLVMLDGRQMQTDATTILQQLPANAIEDIEIITTPSAKYDPDGQAGIIHIKTRRGATDGFYLLVNARIGAPSIEPYDNAETARRFGGDITLNWRKNAWDISAGIDYLRDDLSGRREGYVNTYLDGILTEYPSDGERSFDNYQYGGRLAVRYQPTERHGVSANFFAGDRTKFRTADILYMPQQRRLIPQEGFIGTEGYWERFQQTGTVTTDGELVDSLTYYNENLRVREGDFFLGSLDYTWKPSSNAQLTLSALYERTLLGGPTDNAVLAWPNVADSLQYQFNTNDNPLDGVRLKADFMRQFGDVTWESGYQFRYLFHPGDFDYFDRDFANDRFVVNPEFTNRIELRRQIHGVYTQVSGAWKKLQYGIGIRLEYMDRQVTLATPDTTFDYQLFQPFPTLNLQYDLGGNWSLKGGYSRRIERTTTFKLTPFPEREHNETLEQGDAELLPEFIDLGEIGLVKRWGDNAVFATGYLRQIQNVINRVNTVYNDSILNRIYTNVGTARAIGLELGSNLSPTDWLRVSLGGNVYQYRIQGTLFGAEINTANVIYSINATADVDLAKNWTLQAAFNYLSERITAQGVDSRFYNPSLILRRSFFEGKLTASLQWLSMDLGLLASNEQRITTLRDNFYTTTNYVYEVDRILLILSYRLNQPSKQVKFIESEFGGREF